MKKLIKIAICLVVISSLTSCLEPIKKDVYPKYSLTTMSIVPDSLKREQREWVKETIRAANQNLTAGDYEDIDDTIDETWSTSEKLFEVDVICLYKDLGPEAGNSILIRPNEMTKKEKQILINLRNN